MTDSDIREIFSRFENLNLFNLRHSLVLGRFAMGSWAKMVFGLDRRVDVCPLGHGRYMVGGVPVFRESYAESLFRNWFDGHMWSEESAADRVRRLLSIVSDILKERVDDAEAIQSMICEGQNVVESDCLSTAADAIRNRAVYVVVQPGVMSGAVSVFA